MKIIRDGKEYELTWQEMYDAHRHYEHENFKEDVEARAQELGIELSTEKIDEIADIAESYADTCDSLWDSYWLCVQDAIEENVGEE